MSLLEAMGACEERPWLPLGLGRAGISGHSHAEGEDACVQRPHERAHTLSCESWRTGLGWVVGMGYVPSPECGQYAKGCVQPVFHMRARQRHVPSLPQESGEVVPGGLPGAGGEGRGSSCFWPGTHCLLGCRPLVGLTQAPS